ncbi:MAG TPA: DUF2817 domain-containing protein [Tepidisphaeraceae bacterium]|nr:DUF2817 domain-containing protein [Tepidisphaeraceae bacterium]
MDSTNIHITSEHVEVLGQSVKGRPIELHLFNGDRGGDPVLIFAGIHGDEPTSVYCAKELLKVLEAMPSVLQGVPVAIVTVANPDGLAADTRVNAHGVDLNRNFPAANWKRALAHTRYYSGTAPLSEPESRILYELIGRLKPRRICSIHSIGQGKQQNNYDGPAKGLAEVMSGYNHYPASPNIGYDTFGSFGSWAGVDGKVPMITLELPNRQKGEGAWADNREALLAFIRGK